MAEEENSYKITVFQRESGINKKEPGIRKVYRYSGCFSPWDGLTVKVEKYTDGEWERHKAEFPSIVAQKAADIQKNREQRIKNLPAIQNAWKEELAKRVINLQERRRAFEATKSKREAAFKQRIEQGKRLH